MHGRTALEIMLPSMFSSWLAHYRTAYLRLADHSCSERVHRSHDGSGARLFGLDRLPCTVVSSLNVRREVIVVFVECLCELRRCVHARAGREGGRGKEGVSE
jgi:hypothetical protein